jgi:hypothetical protein
MSSKKHNLTKIYLSYAYVDNQNFEDNDRAWVSAFKDDLENEISFLLGTIIPITIFHNKQFESPNLLTVQYIRATSIFISIGTPAYFISDYCQKELNLFFKRKDIHPTRQIFLVDKRPFEDANLQASLPLKNFLPFYDLSSKTEWSRRNSEEKYSAQITNLANQIRSGLL